MSLICLISKEWPTKEEDWINLVQKYWNEKEKEQQRLKDVLNDINNAMKQVYEWSLSISVIFYV